MVKSVATEALFIDGAVSDIEKLREGVKPGVLVFVLDTNRDGLSQIAEILRANDLHALAAIQIVAHGAEGQLKLGSTTLTDARISSYSNALGEIGAALVPGGDLQLYGCDVASGASGAQFIADLSKFTGADVAAATHIVGSTILGGSWTLDATTGPIEVSIPFTAEALANFHDLLLVFDATWNVVGVGDFNGDGRNDLAYHRASDGLTEVQFLNGPAGGGGLVVTAFDASWAVVGAGDFNGDGKADLVFHRASDGLTEIQFLNGTTGIGGGLIANSPFDATWNVVGVGDFNGDGRNDLAYHRASDGLTEVQFLNGLAPVGGGLVTTAFDSSWAVAGAGDFNSDGKADLVFHRASDGKTGIQFLNGISGAGGGVIANSAFDATWNVVGVGDFNGDGKNDLVYHRASDGLTEIQFLDGIVGIGGGLILNSPFDASWEVVGVRDFNGDGKADLVFHRASDGETQIAFMDGLLIIGGGTTDTVVAGSPLVDSNVAANNVTEGDPNGTAVGITVASGTPSGSITFALADSAGGRFAVNPATGVVTVLDATKIDFETSGAAHSYSIIATATSGGLTTAQTFVIGVNNVAPSVPIDANAAVNTIAEGAAVNAAVGVTASATDINGPAVVYSLTGDSSSGGFKIDPATGVVTVADGTKIDFETSGGGHSYNITVRASDGTLATTQNFTIGVTDVVASTPIDSNAASNSVVEGAANGSTVGVTVSSVDPNGPAPTYSLTNNAGGRFQINPSTGVVTVLDGALLDFENTGPSHTYTITAQAAVGAVVTATQDFAIAVTNVNPPAPTDANAALNTVTEGAAANTLVAITASSTDINGPAAVYSLTADTSNGGFKINATTGVVSVADGSKIDFENSGAGHSYDITVQASDGAGGTSTQNFTIGVTDVNDNAPVFSSGTSGTEAEGTAIGNVVYDANAADADGTAPNNTITYSLSAGGDNDLFAINSTTGEVTFKVAPNFEAPGDTGTNNVYDIVVHAVNGPDDVTKNVAITVTDVNDNAPVFSSGATGGQAENAPTATVAYDANAADADGTAPNNTITYSLSAGGDNDLFDINSTTGEVTFKVAPNFEAPGDTGTNNVYDIVVHAVNGPDDVTQNVAITVTDVNDNAPVFSSGTSGTEAEGTAIGNVVYDANAADADGTAPNNTITYSLSAGGDNDLFAINSTTGEVTFKVAPNFEAPGDTGTNNVYDIVVHAVNGADDVTKNVAITVTNLPPSVPVDGNGAANEASNGAGAGSGTGVDADATDPGGGTVTFGLFDSLGAVADGGGRFTINSSTGVVTVSGVTPIVFDFTPGANNNYTITVRAQDASGQPNNVSFQDFVISVTPNAPPTIDVDGTINYVENDAATVVDSTITITDTDDVNMESAKVQITSGFVSGEDELTFTPVGAITGSFVGDTLSLSGTGTIAEYEQVLESVKYRNLSNDPSGTDRILSYTVNDGAVNSAADTATVHVAPKNDEPTLTATGLNPGFTENGSPVDLYSTVAAATVEAGQSLDQLILTVTNVTGATESLLIDGTTVALTNGNSQTTATNGMTAAVVLAAGTATVTISKVGGISSTSMQTLVDGLAYGNASDDPGAASRVVTLTSLRDTGLNGGGDDNINSTLSIASTVAVTPLNDEPTLTATGLNPAFTENDAAKDLFSTVTASTIEAGQTLDQLVLTVTNVAGSTAEFLNIDGTQVELTNGNSETTATNGMTAVVTVASGTATVTVSKVAGITSAQMQTLVDGLSYGNTSDDPGAATRVVTITSLSDNGANGGGNDDTAALTIQSSVTVTPVNDAPTPGNFTFNGANSAIGNTALVVNDPTDGAPDPTGPQKTITGDLLAGATDPDGPGPLVVVAGTFATNDGGTVIIEADGDFTYFPVPGGDASDFFTYTVSDQNPGTPGTGIGTVTITVATPHVWYVDDSAAPGGDGTSDNPFNSFASLNGAGGAGDVDVAGDVIFLYNGTYSGLQLENNQQLISQSNGLTVNGTLLEAASGSNALINGTVTLASGNTIQGINFGATAGFALTGTNVGTAIINTVTAGSINNTLGGAISITNGDLDASFSSIAATGGAQGILLTNIDNSSFTVTGTTTINDATADGIAISNSQNSIFTFTGKTTILNDAGGANGDGVDLQTNNTTDSTFNFNGGVDITVNGTDAFGFRAQSSGTVNILNPNSDNQITSNNGTAIFINPTTFQASLTSVTAGDGGTGDGIHLEGVSGTGVTIGSVNITGSGGDGLDITNSSANITINGGSIGTGNDPTGIGVDIAGGTGNVTVGATVNKTTAGDVVEVTGRSAGTVDFNGLITSTNGGGIDINTNTGGTVRFDGGMNLSTGATSAFNATGNTGMTLVVTDPGAGSNILTTSTGTALNVANTTIGAEGLTFQSISASGGSTGIVLNTTGSLGGLTVTGTGADGSGGTIQNTTGRGASFISASNISLSDMNFTNAGTTDLDATNGGLSTGDNLDTNAAVHLVNVTTVTLDNINISGGAEQGINGNTVANFNLIDSTITNVGNAADEDNIHFFNMSGTSSIINTTLTHTSGGGDDNLNLQTTSGNLDLTISGGGAVGTGGGVNQIGSGYLFGIRGTTVANINFDNASSTNNFSGGIVADVFENATMNLRVNNSTSSGNNDQLSVSAGDNSQVDLEVTNNVLSSPAVNDFVVVSLLGSAFDTGYTFDARIHDNDITVANNLSADGITVNNAGGGTMNVAITDNTFDYAGSQRAILLQTGSDGAGILRATVTGNDIDIKLDGTSNAVTGVLAQAGVASPEGDGAFLDLNIGGAGALANTFTHSLGGVIAGGDIRVRQRFADNMNLDGYANGANDTAAVITYLNSRNNEVSSATATTDGPPGGFSGNASPTFITVSVSAASVLEDGGTNLVYTFTRSGSTAGSLVANFAVTGTATAGTDFVLTGATTFTNGTGLGTITFAAGSATAQITVDPTPDSDATEFNEVVVVDVGNSTTANGSFARAIVADDSPLMAALGGVAAGNASIVHSTVAYELTQEQLDSLVAAAIARWEATGLTSAQDALLHNVTVAVANMSGLELGSSSTGHITFDSDAGGFGWFVDSTPSDDVEFGHALATTRLQTDPTEVAAGHIDLLTAVMHEMGHQLGLSDLDDAAARDDLMFDSLVTGERRLPDAVDAGAYNIESQTVDVAKSGGAQLPTDVQAPTGMAILVGTAGDDTLYSGQGGNILVGGAGADTFVFDQAPQPTAKAGAITHIADYSAAQGDSFDFSAVPGADQSRAGAFDAVLVRVVEDASGTFATLAIKTGDTANWADVAVLDGVHSGDVVNVTINPWHHLDVLVN